MAGVAGRDWLIKHNTSGSTFNTIGGATSIAVTINNTPVDITTMDDNGVRTLLAGAGVKSVSISFSGTYIDDQYLADVKDAALANTHETFQITDPATTNGGTYEGTFMIANFSETAEEGSATTVSFTLESAGAVTFS